MGRCVRADDENCDTLHDTAFVGRFDMGQERRCKQRFDLFFPITVSVIDDKSTVSATTRNISSGGVYFYTPGRLREGDAVEFRLTLPAIVTQAGDMRAACRGEVLRIDSHPGEGLSGAAVRIDTLSFVTEVDVIQPLAKA